MKNFIKKRVDMDSSQPQQEESKFKDKTGLPYEISGERINIRIKAEA